MSASRIGEDRAGVRSLGEREPKARSNEPCPMRASSLRPPAGSGEGEAQALSPASIEIQRQRDNAQGHRREADARFARGNAIWFRPPNPRGREADAADQLPAKSA